MLNWLANPRWRVFLATLLAAAAIGALLASVDGAGRWLPGFAAYGLVTWLGLLSIFGVQSLLGLQDGEGKQASKIATAAYAARLLLGVFLTLALPYFGYPKPVYQAGYIFTDAYVRDNQAWQIVTSHQPVSIAFSHFYSGDQYGGLLALSAALYRFLSPDAHRQMLIILVTAAAAAWGTLCLYKAGSEWFGQRAGILAAWIFALYPESILLGSSQMREAFVFTGVAMALFGIVEMRQEKGRWALWMAGGIGLMLFFQPPMALVTAVVLFFTWLLDPLQKASWQKAALLGVLLVTGLMIVASIWSSLPSLQGQQPSNIFQAWLYNNFIYQSGESVRESGMLKNLLDAAGPRWHWLIFSVYGIAQPVLPAQIGDPGAALLMRLIGFFRAAGWYVLAPFLVYALFRSLQAQDPGRRWQLTAWSLFSWGWAVLAALNAGADQWDNPRYRAVFLAIQALLAGWAWLQAKENKDPWLSRWLIVEGIFVLFFSIWYIGRYYVQGLHLDLPIMITLTLGVCLLILVGGWLHDRRVKQ